MQSPSSMLNFPSESTSAEAKVASSGVTTNLLYKLSGYVAYTSVAFSTITDAISTLTAGGPTESEPSTRKGYNDGYLDDVMQINAESDGAYDDDEMSEVEIEYNSGEINKKLDKKADRKDEVKWSVNDDPPPPYDSSWAMPNEESNSGPTDAPSMPISTELVSSTTSHVENKPTSQTIPRRRQIRVRRPRRLLRKKSTLTEVSTPKNETTTCDDPDKMLLKVNDKLSDMIAQARAALTSTVDVTEVDMLLAEEREREEKIMKELGLQTPIGRKGRKNTSFADYDYFTSISDGNYSSPESSYEFGYGAYGSGFASPTGYDTPDAYPSHGHYSPSQFPPQPTFNNYSNLGYSLNNNHNHNHNHNNGKFAENDFMNPIPNRFYTSPPPSNGFVEHAIPKGFGNGPVSGFGGARLRFGQNNAFGANYGPSFAPPPPNGGFGSNGGYEASGMYRGYM